MAVITGERGAIPTAQPIAKPKVLANPWNINIPGSGLASNNGTGGAIPLHPAAAPTPAAPAAPAEAAAAPPAPIDFNALTLADPEYTQGAALLARQNTMNLKALKDAWLRGGQSSQDSYNAHGGLFSGAAANAQRSINQDYETGQARQALDYDQGGSGLYFSVFNRLTNKLGQPLGVS